jgi:hypothetical protein
MDAETWERKSDVPREGRAGEKLCSACIDEVEEKEKAAAKARAEAEESERRLWETH